MLIECVPNFSEGRNREVIDAIAAEIRDTAGVMLLDVDPGAATHRTVMTFVGPPDAVSEAAFRAIRCAAQRIDMSRHAGEHPRMGATDVCPFVPVQGATMDDCVELSRRLGRRVGEELGIPVYLYECAATRPERRSLASIREGEYEGLAAKLRDPAWAPDFGPAEFSPRSGATVIGAREFLIAWNVNVNTRDKKVATRIANALREKGTQRRDASGKLVRGPDGAAEWEPGRFRELRGVGWYIPEYGRAQMSFNLTNYRVTGMHQVFDACCEEAERHGVRVTGSELVGLVPLEAILAAGEHYLAKQGATTGVPEREKVHAATLSMGLSELAPFRPEDKIIELRWRTAAPPTLVGRSVTEFVDEVSADSPAPGGGSVAALAGAMSAALSAMVAALTWSKKGMESVRPEMKEIGDRGQALKAWFLEAVDRDARAFDAVLAAARLPKGAEARQAALDAANLEAAAVPLEVAERAAEAADLALAAARDGNPNSLSDAGVAGACALAACQGAVWNVRINLPSIRDEGRAAEFSQRATGALERASTTATRVRETVDAALRAQA